MKSGISVAYSGVHQTFQLALAAHELGRLARFYCSIYDGAGKWGEAIAPLVGAERLRSRRVEGLPGDKIHEYPWPLLAQRSRARLHPDRVDDWLFANAWFDGWVARQLRRNAVELFIGTETCAAASFAVARERGMLRVLDCPGIDAEFRNRLALEAGDELGLRTVSRSDAPQMRERKQRELGLADAVFVCSELQARLLTGSVAPPKGIHVIPLWAETSFWRLPQASNLSHIGPLRVLYAGKISLRKGVPYLVHAAGTCDAPVQLTLTGSVEDELRPFLGRYQRNVKLMPPCSKLELRQIYYAHDLLVLPSLADAFGFVAMEAMACGLPVIVTANCGVPVPDASWRVPVMNSDAIARRLALYANDRGLCREHGQAAAAFAQTFTPARYRDRVKHILARLPLPAAAESARPSSASFGAAFS